MENRQTHEEKELIKAIGDVLTGNRTVYLPFVACKCLQHLCLDRGMNVLVKSCITRYPASRNGGGGGGNNFRVAVCGLEDSLNTKKKKKNKENESKRNY